MTLTLDLNGNTSATLVSCYVPAMASSEQEKNDFYNQLRNVISNVQRRSKLILMGTSMLG